MSRATKTQTRTAELLDKELLRILKTGGEPVILPDGTVAIDAKGNVIRRPPSAATLNVIRGRIKDLGINAVPVKGSSTGDLVEQARRRGLKINGRPVAPMQPLSEDDDAATA